MAENQQTSLKRPRPFWRVPLALTLAALVCAVLPDNRDAVTVREIARVLPGVAREVGEGVWTLSDGSDWSEAFERASSVRHGEASGDPIRITLRETRGAVTVSARSGESLAQRTVRPPTAWSLFPPIAAILVAILSGRLILGLAVAVLSGGFMAVDAAGIGYPFLAFRKAAVDYVWSPLESSFQLYILAFTAALIGMVRVTSLAGGNRGIADRLARGAHGARSTRMAAFLMGLAIFFDDYANTIVVGSTLRPIADRFKVSREKLAYIVDSTAAPIAGVALISTWIGYEVGLFEDLMGDLGTGVSGYELFFAAMPARFYCLLTLLFVAASTWLGRDYGPMLAAERRAQITGRVLREGAVPMTGHDTEVSPAPGVVPQWWTAAVPVLAVIAAVIGGMALDTYAHEDVAVALAESGYLSVNYWTECFSNADSARVLFHASILGSLLAIVFAVTRRREGTGERAVSLVGALTTYIRGIAGVYYAIVILILAWAIKEVCSDAGTSTYLTAALDAFLSPTLLPLLIFLLASVVAFAIGTSWATMAILIPTVVPLAHAMGGLPVTILAAAAVLDGAIFGDHCSPISDTTVMSSISSSCDHMDHVRTQIPYALTTMSIAGLLGYLGSAALYPAWVGLLLGAAAVLGVILFVGKPTDTETA